MSSYTGYSRLLFLLVLLLLGSLFHLSCANCDVYRRTMDSIEYWDSYDFREGMTEALRVWYSEDAVVTLAGTPTMKATEFYESFQMDQLAKLKIRVQSIDCATDGEWCHLNVYCTYTNTHGETVSLPQYWTYLYDPVTCLWEHYIILSHSNDLEVMMDTLSTNNGQNDREEEL